MNDPEKNDFLAEMSDVKPLQPDRHILKQQAAGLNDTKNSAAKLERRRAAQQINATDNNYLSTEYVDLVEPLDLLEFKKSGVQEGVFKKLRLGKYQLEATLNLHHLSIQQARSALFEFISDCLTRNIRTVLVQHGTGQNSKPHPAILKSYTNKWLREMPEVLAFHSAHKAHGGYGALYVLIRKSENKKQENREIHAKR